MGFVRDPGTNTRKDAVQRLSDIAEQMRRERGNATVTVPRNRQTVSSKRGATRALAHDLSLRTRTLCGNG
jgi:hypothetical protein